MRADEFKECKIAVISYGNAEAITKWKEETRCPFAVYRDPDRTLYDMFGLEQSIKRVWNQETICSYAAMKVAGKKLPLMCSDDDPHQMGGDFILDNDGSVLLHYASTVPSDRPSIEKLLEYCVDTNK